jgi:hypothetical protein
VRPLVYLLGGVLVLPGLLLAVAFRVLDAAIAKHSFFGFFWALLVRAYHLLTWGIWLILLALLAWLAAAFMARYRFAGAALTVVLGALAIFQMLLVARESGDNALFYPLLTLAGMALAGWLVYAEGPWRQV